MWLLAYGPAVFGVVLHRRWDYWRWVLAIFAAVCAGEFLFSGRGSADHPEHDGLVTRAIRQASDDGPILSLVGLVFAVLFWGGVIYCFRRLYREARRPAEDVPTMKPASRSRKVGELILLTLLLAALTFVGVRSAAMRADTLARDAALEANLDFNVAAVNAKAPEKLDEVTVLTRASRDGRTLVLEHEITDKAFTRAAMEAYLREKKPAEICSLADARSLLEEGGA